MDIISYIARYLICAVVYFIIGLGLAVVGLVLGSFIVITCPLASVRFAKKENFEKIIN